MHTPQSMRPSARKSAVFYVLAVMLLLTVGAGLEKYLLGMHGMLSIAWYALLLILAVYWLRLFLADWSRRIGLDVPDDLPPRR